MPSYVQLTEEELRQLHLLRSAADDKASWTSKAVSKDSEKYLDSFVVDFPETPSPSPHLTPVFRGKTLRLKITNTNKKTTSSNNPTQLPNQDSVTNQEPGKQPAFKGQLVQPKDSSGPKEQQSRRRSYRIISPTPSSTSKENQQKKAVKKSVKAVKAVKAAKTTQQESNKRNKEITISQSRNDSKKLRKTTLPKGCYESWRLFGEAGGYSLSIPAWLGIRDWVFTKKRNEDFVADNVAFHRLVVAMKAELQLESARDKWIEALPSPESSNFEICVLFLMVCTPLVPDTKIVELFAPIFKDNFVDIDWILQKGKVAIAEILRPLGRQNDSAKYVVEAALALKTLDRFPRDYRDLVKLPGIGPKVALVTVQEAFGLVQGVPCDVHMCRIFQRLGWIPSNNTLDNNSISIASILETKKDREKFDYELSRAAIEGWFPRQLWGEMNQTWAGLGQLLNDAGAKRKIALYVDSKVADLHSPWRVADKVKLAAIMSAYT
jgi:endonuclease III